MQYGKTIEMFLVDGDASGLVTAELSNWNGKAIKIPRTMIKKCTHDDFKGSTVSEDIVPSFVEHGNGYYRLRCEFEESGVIRNGVFEQDEFELTPF